MAGWLPLLLLRLLLTQTLSLSMTRLSGNLQTASKQYGGGPWTPLRSLRRCRGTAVPAGGPPPLCLFRTPKQSQWNSCPRFREWRKKRSPRA